MGKPAMEIELSAVERRGWVRLPGNESEPRGETVSPSEKTERRP